MDLSEIETLHHLLEPGSAASRADLHATHITSSSLQLLDEVLDRIELLIFQRAVDSRLIADVFWEEVESKISKGEKVSLGHRVRVRKGTLEISYHRNIYQEKRKRAVAKKYFADHIARSAKFQYLSRDFRFAQTWEREIALFLEEKHKINRKIFRELSIARKSIRSARKMLAQNADGDGLRR